MQHFSGPMKPAPTPPLRRVSGASWAHSPCRIRCVPSNEPGPGWRGCCSARIFTSYESIERNTWLPQSNILKRKKEHHPTPNPHGEILMPNAMVLESRAFGRWVGHGGGALVNGASVLTKEAPERSCSPTPCEDMSATWKRALTEPLWHPNLRLPGSGTLGDRCLLFISCPTCGISLAPSEQTETSIAVTFKQCRFWTTRNHVPAQELGSYRVPCSSHSLATWEPLAHRVPGSRAGGKQYCSDRGASALTWLFALNQQPQSEHIVWGSKNGSTVASLNTPPNNSFTKGEKFDYLFTFSSASLEVWDAKDTIIPPLGAILLP